MQRILVILFLVFTSLAARAQTYNVAAYTFHQTIISEQENIGDKIYDFIRNANRRNLHKLQLQIEHSCIVIDSLKAYNNENEYLNTAKNLFQFYKLLSKGEYANLQKLVENDKIEPKEFQAEKQKIFSSIKQKSYVIYEPFNKAQDAFCLKYGIKLE